MQTPSPTLLPCDLRPFPTALSDFSSFKGHINYSNEARRDPALCRPELGTHSVSPLAPSPAASCPHQLGFLALGLSAAVTVHPHPLQERRIIGSPPKVNALLAGSSRVAKSQERGLSAGHESGLEGPCARADERLLPPPALTGGTVHDTGHNARVHTGVHHPEPSGPLLAPRFPTTVTSSTHWARPQFSVWDTGRWKLAPQAGSGASYSQAGPG